MAMTPNDFVVEARDQIQELGPGEADALERTGAVMLDVRDRDEYLEGSIPRSVHISRGLLEFKAGRHPALADRERPIVAFCGTGGRSALAAVTLKRMGFANVSSLGGGLDAWLKLELPWDPHPTVD